MDRNVRVADGMLSAEARRFADVQQVAHLATVDGDGAPHVIPLCYALVGNAFYFVVDDKPKRSRNLKRLRNIAANPRVALVIDHYDEDWSRLAYLLVHGDAAAVEDGSEYATALAALRSRYPQYRSMPLALATHAMVRITPRRCHLWRVSRPG